MAGTASRRTIRKPNVPSRRRDDDNVPDVYKDMLAGALSSPTQSSGEGRPIKKRRVGGRIVAQRQPNSANEQSDIDDLFEEPTHAPQNIIQTESEDSADSDVNWEEVELKHESDARASTEPEGDVNENLQLVLGGEEQGAPRSKLIKRKPITAEEKKLRLEIHKMHVCSLLAHVYLRNHWCNDEAIHSTLARLLPKKTISYLNPDETLSQFQRSRSFTDGLEKAIEYFRTRYKITARGMRNSRWAEDPRTVAKLQPPDDIDLPMQKDDFRSVATSFRASRDVGAQIFCALLRSVGVDARLVCSLQPLPFQTAPKIELPVNKYASTVVAEPRSRSTTPEAVSDAEPAGANSRHAGKPIGSLGGLSRFAMHNTTTSSTPPIEKSNTNHPKRPIHESKYPIYWIEAFNEAVSKWIPVDPFVPQRTSKPTKFEPPAGESENNMSYVVAFEDDNIARDVTRRYAKAYNAKTRRNRVEMTKGGEKWWKTIMKIYRPRARLDRDQIEDAELTAKEAAEPMPRNVQDLKDHPYYALERHLRRHEVIHPKREVGKLGAGRGHTAATLEPIYRRRDVLNVQSADKWYRSGREIKTGEQPIKRVPSRRPRDASVDPEDQDADGENVGTGLYAVHQTKIYIAPPIVNGRIPRNAYGNLDIYTPSMVPPGGVHIQQPDTVRAAKLLGIEFADAVTGFVFKGRHGTAVVNGAVVASEYQEAVQEVVKAFSDDRARAEQEQRSFEAIRVWKRFLAGLRIRQRIEGYDVEGEQEGARQKTEEPGSIINEESDGGGFFPDHDAGGIAQPTADRVDDVQNLQAGTSRRHSDRFLDDFEDDEGGGFMVDDGDAEEAMQEASRPQDDKDLLPTTAYTGQNEAFSQCTLSRADQGSLSEAIEKPEQDGGGFMLVDNDQNAADAASDKPENDLDLTHEQFAEAKQLQELYETEQMEIEPSKSTAMVEDKVADQTAPMEENHLFCTEKQSSFTIASPAEGQGTSISEESVQAPPHESDSSEEDKGSLMSEDPEDEDAEPEWLA